MSRINRLFEVVQELRRADRPVRGQELAEKLEVSLRTIYRDCASLLAMGIPIEGEAGIGYVMRSGYDLPPLSFTKAEREAINVGLRMLGRTGDQALVNAADGVLSKLAVAEQISENISDVKRFVSQAGAPVASSDIVHTVRDAIDCEHKLVIEYRARDESVTLRKVWPLCLVYYPDATVVASWCELRDDFRHFRLDWLLAISPTIESFAGKGHELRKQWQEREDWSLSYPGAIARDQ